MPIANGKYVAPTWVNGTTPAIDAAELQAMSDTIESNQGSRGLNLSNVKDANNALSVLRTLPNAKAASINGVAYGNGIVCAVTGNGKIAYNENGFDWLIFNASNVSKFIDIDFGNGVFCAIGERASGSNVIATFSKPYSSIAYNDSLSGIGTMTSIRSFNSYWYVGTSTQLIRFSDPTNPTTSALLSFAIYDLDCDSQTAILAATDRGVYKSTNGTSFTVPTNSPTTVRKISADSGKILVIAGSEDGRAAYYYNGTSGVWVNYENPSENYARFADCVIFGADVYVVLTITDTEDSSITWASIRKNPFGMSEPGTTGYGGLQVVIYGETVSEITSARVVNGEAFFGAPYGGVIQSAKIGNVVDSAGRAVIPQFYGTNTLENYIVDVAYSTYIMDNAPASDYLGGVRTMFLDGRIAFDLRGAVRSSGLGSKAVASLTIQPLLTYDLSNILYSGSHLMLSTASLTISGNFTTNYPSVTTAVHSFVTSDGEYKCELFLASAESGKTLSTLYSSFSNIIRFSVHIECIPYSKMQTSV